MFKQSKEVTNQKMFSLGGSQADGSTYVSTNALETIASLAIQDIKGVSQMNASATEAVSSLIGLTSGNAKGVKVTQNADGSLNFVVKLSVEFGTNIPKIALVIQNAVKTSVNEATDLVVKDVDLVIERYTKEEDKAKKSADKAKKATKKVAKKTTKKPTAKKTATKKASSSKTTSNAKTAPKKTKKTTSKTSSVKKPSAKKTTKKPAAKKD